MSAIRILSALSLLPLLGGCLVRTAADVISLPVKAVSAGVDAATTSQAEADQKRGRAIREAEEREGREARRREQEQDRLAREPQED